MLLRIIVLLNLLLVGACTPPNKRLPNEQKLRLNLYCEPPSLDSRKATDATSMNVLVMLFEGLMRIGFDNKPHLAVAESYEVSKDGLSYKFKLRNALWNNGEPVTAEDFAYAWKKILDPKFPSLFAYKLYPIKNAEKVKEGKLPLEELGLQVLNSKTLLIHLNHPTPYFLELLAFPTYFPINKKIDETHPEWSNEAGPLFVSNGPFILKDWEHESELIVEKNPLYWDAPEVKLQSIHLSMIDDTTTEFYMYEMGELDWTGSPLSNLSPEILPALKEQGKTATTPATAVYYYKINTEKFPFGNQKLRRAIALAVNRKDIVEHITQADQIPALGLIPPMPGWEKPSNLYKDNDLVEAKKLFAEALSELGIKKEQLPPLVISFNTNREHQKIAQAIQYQWKEAFGIDVELESFEWKVYLSKINKQDYQIGRMGWIGDFHDPVSFLEPFKYKDNPAIGGNNETGWEHPDYIQFLDEAEKEIHPKKRNYLLREAEKLLIDEMPIIPIYYICFNYLKKPYVKGVYISPLGIVDYKMAYIE